jgi:dephospho-CoA kinase
MNVYALTGGIASGKSTVAQMFADLGAEVRSADIDAREVLIPPSPTLQAVLTAFPDVQNPDGTVNRQRLGEQIFSDPEARQRLNAIMHPAIRLRMRAAIDSARSSDCNDSPCSLEERAGVLLYEVPLLYEGGLETWFDGVVVVLANRALQAERLQAREAKAGRPPLTEEQIAERLQAQMSPEEKAERADFVIRTDIPLRETEAEVRQIWQRWQHRQNAVPPE